MRAIATLICALAVLGWSADTRAEKLVVGLSSTTVHITSNFTGADLTLFGAIERDHTTKNRLAAYDVVIVLRGPDQSIVARRKEWFFGIWVNRRSRVFKTVPAFYEVVANRPMDDMLTEEFRKEKQIGIDAVDLGPVPWTEEVFGEPEAFKSAFLRLKTDSGLYRDYQTGVSFLSANLFRAKLILPENIPVGRFAVSVYLLSDGEMLERKDQTLTITKSGFESTITNLATNHALFYGLGTVALALFTGWVGGVVFRRD